jgi:hypothetical protein
VSGPVTTDPNPLVMPVTPAPVSANPDPTVVGRGAMSLNDYRRLKVDINVWLCLTGAERQQTRRENGQ